MISCEPTQPGFTDATVLTYLSGFSGAQVALMERSANAMRFVRKFAAGETAIARLIDQKAKIERLALILEGRVTFPEILAEQSEDGWYWYDMEFVAGVDGISYLSAGSRANAHMYRAVIEEVLHGLRDDQDPNQPIIDLCGVIRAKLDEIDQRTSGRFTPALDGVRDSMAGMDVPAGPTSCHGDLTLENMIFGSDGRVTLIDPIPAPLEHFWFDIAKIFQDLEGRWYLNRKRHLQFGVSASMADIITDSIRTVDPSYFTLHRPMLALSFARILPYCTSADEEEFVHGRVLSALRSRAGDTGHRQSEWSASI